MRHIRLLYLLCFLSPVAFLCGYIAGAPSRISPPVLDFGGIDNRHLPVESQDYLRNQGSMIIGEGARLAPNSDLQAR